jgi:hypothetical protein
MSMTKIITGSIAALALADIIAATPASAGGYYHRSGPIPGAEAGAAIAGMALGAMAGAAASQPRHAYYGQPSGGYGYDKGYAPHGGGYYGDDGY